MGKREWQSGHDLRVTLLRRAKLYSERRGIGITILSRKLTGNTAFLSRVARSGNVTFETWDHCMRQLDRMFEALDKRDQRNGASSQRHRR